MRYLHIFAFLIFPVIANANECELDVSSSDTMTFNTRTLSVSSNCEEVTVNFHHKGLMPKTGMGHNWVLTKNSDVADVAKAGVAAGLENNFLPKGDLRIIAATPILGGGESSTIKFKMTSLNKSESYTYFCSFPGHWSMMRGTLKIID